MQARQCGRGASERDMRQPEERWGDGRTDLPAGKRRAHSVRRCPRARRPPCCARDFVLVQHDGMIAELVDANVRLAFAELRERDDASSVSSNGRGTAISVTIPRHCKPIPLRAPECGPLHVLSAACCGAPGIWWHAACPCSSPPNPSHSFQDVAVRLLFTWGEAGSSRKAQAGSAPRAAHGTLCAIQYPASLRPKPLDHV